MIKHFIIHLKLFLIVIIFLKHFFIFNYQIQSLIILFILINLIILKHLITILNNITFINY